MPQTQKQSHKAPDVTDLVWGIHPILEILNTNPNQIREIIVLKNRQPGKIDNIIALARQHNLRIHYEQNLPPGLDKHVHQGIIARIRLVSTLAFEDLLDQVKNAPGQSILLALDCIQDPHNLGAIIRSAAAAGVIGIILPKDRSAPLSGTVAKASAGALSHMPICQVTNLAETLKRLREEGIWIYGADKDTPLNIYQADFSGPICLVIGSEGKGMRPLVKKQCDFLITIPMRGNLDSLNASVATAVILFEIVRRQ